MVLESSRELVASGVRHVREMVPILQGTTRKTKRKKRGGEVNF